MLSRQLEVSLRLAVSMARQKRHEFLTVEHLLLALLDNDSAVNALKACGADIVTLRKELEEYVEQHTPKLGDNSEQAPHPTESFDRILQLKEQMYLLRCILKEILSRFTYLNVIKLIA